MNNKKRFITVLSSIFHILTLLLLVFILILVLKTDILERIHNGALTMVLEKNLLKYTLSSDDEFNYIYYDRDISNLEKENIEDVLSKLKCFHDEFKENDIRIVISRNAVDTSTKLLFSNLARFEKNISDKTRGSYYPNFNLIILDLYDLDTIYNMFNDMDLKVEYVLELCKELNISTLLHEIGHFFDYTNNNELHTYPLFAESYNNEQDVLFNKDEKYYKSSIEEYIAESISRILMIHLGLLESEEASKNSDTYSILNKYLEYLSD